MFGYNFEICICIFRFNATNMLELIRGKRLVFVGDSINRNQWESLLCLLMGAVKDPSKVYETHGRKITKEKGIYSFRFVVRIIANISSSVSLCRFIISSFNVIFVMANFGTRTLLSVIPIK